MPPPPTNNFRKTKVTPNRLYIVGKGIYRRVRIIKNVGKIFWFRDFMSNFRKVVRFYAIFGSSKKFQTLRIRTYHISFWSGWSGDSKYIICFAKKVKFRGFTKAFTNFAKYIIAFIFAKFKYFAKQIIYLESPDHLLQNDIWYVCVLRVWNFSNFQKWPKFRLLHENCS